MSIHTSLVFIDPGYSKDLRARPGIRILQWLSSRRI